MEYLSNVDKTASLWHTTPYDENRRIKERGKDCNEAYLMVEDKTNAVSLLGGASMVNDI